MKLRSLSHTCVGTTLNLRVAAPPPDAGGNFGKGRGGRPWRRIRELVLKRDGYQCQPCKKGGRVTLAIEVDHITPICEGGSDAMGNLQGICGECHQVKSLAEAARAKARMME